MVKIDGLEQLSRKLKAMPVEAKAGIREALEKSADEMVAMATALAPVDHADLKDSIKKVDGKHELQVFVRAGDDADADHAAFVEFGNAEGVEPIPFFWPSYRAMKKRHRGRLTRAINAAAKKVAGS